MTKENEWTRTTGYSEGAITTNAPERTTGTTTLEDASFDFLARREDALRSALPPGPYRLVWPDKQGEMFSVWGTGWAVPLVAQGVQSVMEALVAFLNMAGPTAGDGDDR